MMGMGLGEYLKVTLFGESHGKCVGALFEGIPAGTEILHDYGDEYWDTRKED